MLGPYRRIRPRQPQSLSDDNDNINAAHLQIRTLSPIKDNVSNSVPEHLFQQVQATPNVPIITSAKSSPRRYTDLETPYDQEQKYEYRGIDPMPVRPASQGDSTSTHYSSYEQANSIKPALAPFTESNGQPQSFFPPFPAFGRPPVSTPIAFESNPFEKPTSSTTAQNQYQMGTLNMGYVPIQAAVAAQSTLETANERRKRKNIKAAQRFRERHRLGTYAMPGMVEYDLHDFKRQMAQRHQKETIPWH